MPLATRFPLFVGVAPPGGEHPRPQELLDRPLPTAVELRLDLGGAWRVALRDTRRLAERVLWLAEDISDVAPPPRVIATCRRVEDGGEYDGSEQERLQLLALCAKVCDFVDVEHGVKADVPAARTIRSCHDFNGIPHDLEALLAEMRAQGGAVFKIAAMASCLSDTLRIREFLRGKRDVAAFLMGEYGVPSRILGAAWGSALSFASLTDAPLAPGMPHFQRLINLYRAERIRPDWEFFGVTGRSVAHSLSPALHNVALCRLNQKRVYLPLAADDAEDFMEFARMLPVSGASVTVPYKQELHAFCARHSDDALAIGAVNTLLRQPDGSYSGANTDIRGFVDDLKLACGTTLLGRQALVLGAGGSARAVVTGLRREGARVMVWSRRPAGARQLANELGAVAIEHPTPGLKLDLLINATPCGMPGHDAEALPWQALQPMLRPDALVYDLVYEPPRTPLLAHVESAGLAWRNGLGMLQRQAALQAGMFGYTLGMQLREPPRVSCHVWLIGYRGSGKSSIARELAVLLHRRPLDTDAMITRRAGAGISELFASRGEPDFRVFEAEAVRAAAESRPDAVIATGGGVIEHGENITRMRKSGVVIFLDAPEALLRERVSGSDRPSLTGKPVADEISEVMARRKPLYESAAHMVYAVSEATAREQARELAAMLERSK
jgi:3-dehydroquinate dehydratase / shikimate dehydrogenase